MGQFKLKFEIDEIEFEAEGEYEDVARERKIFVEEILPLVAKINGCKCKKEEKEEEEVEVVEEVKALKNEKIHAIEDNLIVTPVIVDEPKKVEEPQPNKPTTKKKPTKKKPINKK